ncbi:uncharacterized protein H6S33_004657 [Morchella sextelata]|uniref:uncharacterized protein n=1 Tax=Morchella sextelata TaxID=1174677 RepID=UPI001D05111B|nr:uncharacterized protein H6S33_004657 [Morchella sextelata]KAH0605435.1 hypothetical protein H6S33_004657 [Morchella sextelata]
MPILTGKYFLLAGLSSRVEQAVEAEQAEQGRWADQGGAQTRQTAEMAEEEKGRRSSVEQNRTEPDVKKRARTTHCGLTSGIAELAILGIYRMEESILFALSLKLLP